MLNIIPSPKSIKEQGKKIQNKKIKINFNGLDSRLIPVLKKLPYDDNGLEFEITIGNGEKENYILTVNEDKISLEADGVKGAFYGIQTLRQIYENDNIPCCVIEDCPDFSHRGFYHDVTRGKVPTLDTLKELVDQMAYYKLNSLQLYVEHTFEFKEYDDSIERTGYLTAEEIKELDKYCQDNFIEFIPSLSTFGHLFELLEKDGYKHLCEIENFKSEQVFWKDRMEHHTIDPTNPESFELIKSLIDQYIPLFSSNKFNICCDETFDLHNGRHKSMDAGKLYIDFVTKIIDYVRSKGKTVMMWGDILHEHPEQIEKLPEDVMLLNWEYEPVFDENKIKKFKDIGREQIVCPGTWTWNNLCEDLSLSIPNILKMAQCAYKYGAQGILNTNCGDFGNSCSLELSMCGLTLGAEKSWNVKTEIEEFFQKLDTIVYKHDGATEHIRKLCDIQSEISGKMFVYLYSNKLFENQLEVKIPDIETLRVVQNDCDKLRAELENEKWGNDEYRKEAIIAAEGIEIIAEVFARHIGEELESHTDTVNWLKKYRKAWISKNKESELREIEKLYMTMQS